MDDRNWLSPFDRDDLRSLALWPRQFFNDVFDQVNQARMGPYVDLHEGTNAFTLTAEIPGVSPQDLDITVNEQSVTLKGEIRKDNVRGEKGYRLAERRYGNFYRTVPLPSEINPDQAMARYRDGLVEITLPKMEKNQTRGRKLTINNDNQNNTQH